MRPSPRSLPEELNMEVGIFRVELALGCFEKSGVNISHKAGGTAVDFSPSLQVN
jgi:hypothetical protein